MPRGGVCAVVEDGVPCERAARNGHSGLCSRHRAKALVRGRLGELGLSAAELAALPRVPHLYLHKSVAIRFAACEAVGAASDASAVALVTAVLGRTLRATVSLECVRAVYRHVGHRLARPVELGGLALDDATAERRSPEYVGELFYSRGGDWSFAVTSASVYRACTLGAKHPTLSLEDALEVETFAAVRWSLGCTRLVVADTSPLAALPRTMSTVNAVALLRMDAARA